MIDVNDHQFKKQNEPFLVQKNKPSEFSNGSFKLFQLNAKEHVPLLGNGWLYKL
ncbi:MAG: hypothetical protein MESAZ_01061 [Saezia sanguinis]